MPGGRHSDGSFVDYLVALANEHDREVAQAAERCAQENHRLSTRNEELEQMIQQMAQEMYKSERSDLVKDPRESSQHVESSEEVHSIHEPSQRWLRKSTRTDSEASEKACREASFPSIQKKQLLLPKGEAEHCASKTQLEFERRLRKEVVRPEAPLPSVMPPTQVVVTEADANPVIAVQMANNTHATHHEPSPERESTFSHGCRSDDEYDDAHNSDDSDHHNINSHADDAEDSRAVSEASVISGHLRLHQQLVGRGPPPDGSKVPVRGRALRLSSCSSHGDRGEASPGSPGSMSPAASMRNRPRAASHARAASTAVMAMAAFMDNRPAERAWSKAASGRRRVTWNGDPALMRAHTGMSLASDVTDDEPKLELHWCWHPRDRTSPTGVNTQSKGDSSDPSKLLKQRSFDVTSKDLELFLLAAQVPWWERALSKWVVHPSSNIRHGWDVAGVAMISYALFFVPFQVFDHSEMQIEVLTAVLFTLANVYWTLDVPLSFLSGFNSEGVVDMRLRRIARHYARGWLAFDLLTLLIDWLALGWQIQGAKGEEWLKALRVIGIFRILRLRSNLGEVKERIHSDMLVISLGMVKLVIMIIVLNHLIACTWYGIGIIWLDEQATWLSAWNVRNQSLWMRYSTSLHWSLTQFTPASMEVYPQNAVERTFAICVLVFAMITFSSFISSITNAMKEMQSLNSEKRDQFTMLRRYLRENLVTGGTMVKIWKALQSSMHVTKQRLHETDVNIMQYLPPQIRTDLFEEIYSPAIEKHPVFLLHRQHHAEDAALIYENAISERTLHLGKPLFNTGEACDRMYFVLTGEMSFSRDGSRRKSGLDTITVGPGQWISEAALWVEWFHAGQVTAVDKNCELLDLDVHKFQAALRECEDLARYAVLFWERFRDSPNSLTDVFLDMDVIMQMSHRAFTEGRVQAAQAAPAGSAVNGRRSSNLFGNFRRPVPAPPQLDALPEEDPRQGFISRLHKQGSMLFGVVPKSPSQKSGKQFTKEELPELLEDERDEEETASEDLATAAGLVRSGTAESQNGTASGKLHLSHDLEKETKPATHLSPGMMKKSPSGSYNTGRVGLSSLLGISPTGSARPGNGRNKRTSVAWS